MQQTNFRWMSLSCAIVLGGCNAPQAGTAPAPTPGAVAPAVASTPAPASVTPAPAPSLAPPPPVAENARARLTGAVVLNDAAIAGAALTAFDLATGEAIVLSPWSDAPNAKTLQSTPVTDAQGAFDFELPKLTDGRVIKLVATKGTQSFSALFNHKGQAIGATTPTSVSYRLQQGTAVSVTIRLQLTAATTAATQAFEGALKLTFQLPAGISDERQSAVLEAARKAAQQVEQALAQKPEVAARLVATVNSEGAVTQVDNFRSAITNLGVFDSLFKAVQAELLAVAAQKLEVRTDLAPIDGSEFPLDQVVISASGMLGFSGQRTPINLGGAVTSNFVPTPARGGGGSAATPPPVNPTSTFSLFNTGGGPDGIAWLRGTQKILVARDQRSGNAALDELDLLTNTAVATETALAFPGAQGTFNGITQTQNPASKTVFIGWDSVAVPPVAAGAIFTFEPDTGATAVFLDNLGLDSWTTSFTGDGQIRALAAGRNDVYYMRMHNVAGTSNLQKMYRVSQTDPTATAVVQANSADIQATGARSLAVYDDGVASPTLFWGLTDGSVYMAEDGGASAPLLLGNFGGQVRGLVFASPSLYVSNYAGGQIFTVNVTQTPPSSSVLMASSTYPELPRLTALSIELDSVSSQPKYLYVGGDTSPASLLRVDFGKLL